MKADTGSWLYILLSIVFLIISAISNKNKKRASTSTPPINDDDYEPASPPQRTWPRNFDEVLTEVLDLPKPKPQEVVSEQPHSRTNAPLESTQNSYESIGNEAQSLETIEEEVFTYEAPEKEKKQPEKPLIATKTEETKEKKKEVSLSIFGEKEFDLRQGIIYAEILNRKYF